MFTKSARYYDALYHFKDYTAASRQLHALIQQRNPNASTLLDVGCGTAKHLEVLRDFYQVEGLDVNPELLKIAHRRCPGVRFYKEDMISFELGGTYDVVTCLFSSIGYVKSVNNMETAITNMTRHLKPGGLLIVEPWFSPETYWVGKITANFVDQPDLKIAWMYTSEIDGRVSVFDINYLVGTPDGVNYFTEKHEMGLFTHQEYSMAFEKAGLDVSHDPSGLFGRGMYTGRKMEIRNPASVRRECSE
jgi:ubiquinone/menaquinone biosynthesis C-methylase UbiE